MSMAGASLFLPFLPLLPKQILLNNFLSDVPSMTIATDRVDPEQVDHPRRWDIRFIRNFMLVFGLVSSVFDYVTFGALLYWLRATEPEFQTGWFVESLMTELFIVLVIRTRAVLPEPPADCCSSLRFSWRARRSSCLTRHSGRCSDSCRSRLCSFCSCSGSPWDTSWRVSW